ncbi:hypothetical protein BKA69DRAFT_673056 [Paraphysoderma sedebokerense]|nr:hypothetical protein BKA69DRAFT_673056 [Paraphysoderma sedebokerense]
MRLNWPDKLLQLLNWLSVINFNVELASPECLAREHSFDFSFKLKLALAIPLIVSVLALMLYGSVRALSTCRKKHMKGESLSALYKGGQFWVQNVRAWMSILNLLFVYIATNALALFDCTVEPDGMSYLDADPSLRCYEPWFYHDLPYGILGICLYVIGIPFQSLVVSLAADRARKNLSKQETLRRFQIFCQKIMDSRHEYKLQYQFISVIQLFQRLVMVFVSIFFTRYSGLQVILTQFILLGNILILFRYQPYEFDILNKFDMLSNLAAMIVLGFGLPFHIDNFNPTLQSALIVFILILICGFIVAAIGAVVLECWKHFVLIKANFSSPSRKESTVSYSAKISGWRK